VHQNPLEKSYQLARSKQNLPKSRRSHLRSQPDIQGLTVLKFQTQQPSVGFLAVSLPADKVLIAMAMSSGIEDFFDVIFFFTISSNQQDQLRELS